MMRIFKKGFTLAEVLITLLIVGVIASIVIPGLIQDSQQAERKAAYKKAYAVASQAWRLSVSNGEIDAENNDTVSNANFSVFKAKFSVVQDCPSSNTNCWANGEFIRGNEPLPSYPAFIDNSGMAWANDTWGSMYRYNAKTIFVDTNGFKSPNKYGKDRFMIKFYSNQNNLVPNVMGTFPDYVSIDASNCPSGNCYNSSWLTQ